MNIRFTRVSEGEDMELTQHLYLKVGSDIRGPVPVNVLQNMCRKRELDGSAMFSVDGNKWLSISKLFTAKPTQQSKGRKGGGGTQQSEPRGDSSRVGPAVGKLSEIPELLKRTDRAAQILNSNFVIITYLVFAVSSIALSMSVCLALRWIIPSFSPYLHIGMAVIPAILGAGVLAHSFGNVYIGFLTKLSAKERYSLAIHLPWGNSSADWPLSLKKWLYCSDWLVDNNSGELMPYVRAFVTGKAPDTITEEVELWQNILQGNKKIADNNIGHSVRELACLERLPAWTAEITPGMNLAELEKALGKAGRSWALSLLKRAGSKRADLSVAAECRDTEAVIFEFFCSKLSGGRDCLMVIISPNWSRCGEESEQRALKRGSAA